MKSTNHPIGVLLDLGAAYLGYAFRFVSPLILYPFLTRSLGLESFGIYATAYSAALVLSVITEYGFALTAAREVAAAPDVKARGTLVMRVIFAKALLVPIAVAVGIFLTATSPILRSNLAVAAAAILLGLGQGATVSWFFQGLRKIGLSVALEITGQVIAMVVIILAVRQPSDVVLAISLQATGIWSAVLVGHLLMFRNVPIVPSSMSAAIRTLQEGFSIFLSRSAIAIYTSASVLLVSALAGTAEAALYSAAERVSSASTMLFRPLGSVIMPRIAEQLTRDRVSAFRLSRIALILTTSIFSVFAFALIFWAPWIVIHAFGDRFFQSTPILQTLSIMLPVIAVSQVLGNNLMVPLRLDRHIAFIFILGAIVNLALAAASIPIFGALGMALSRVGTELVISAAHVILLRPYWTEILGRSSRSNSRANTE
ncbi:oligosaccharide flippase family protein [Bradyrhizobium yuanmingense]|uniref:oligosaccharide flippase family protein n=1 Tax=Bradyrhizobium TaxID=374 RepID=UPI001CD688CD|nr:MULTISPECIES: oligosaccharide flippase family protein [unclassified Bradyrhizobium]MCA1512321.1 oligosaccharide flippase family protein [Bradyrhizobium sp. NBAIM01]UWU85787.1 oligosaccharide flippase family protein [Bradyrhizobium sp. CB1024]